MRLLPCLFLPFLLFFVIYPSFALADDPDLPDVLSVTANWNGTALSNDATTTVPTDQTGTFSWSSSYDASDTGLSTYLPTIANAAYTLELYKGTIGDSELLYSQTVPQGSATSSGSFSFEFPSAGEYVLAYTATYPNGTYPLGYRCGGDICIPPEYSLADFERYMETGQTENSNTYGHYIPAILGLDDFTVAAPSGPTHSNILFLPGFMESRLYMKDASGKEKLLWEPTQNADIAQLGMTVEGISRNLIYTRDSIDYLYAPIPALEAVVAKVAGNISPVYGPFEAFLNSLVRDGTIKEWQAFPYDWRYDISDIVQNGTLIGSATGTPERVYLQDAVAALASTSPTGRVTIIGHSEGGLLAKALAVALEKTGQLSLIDKIIIVGAPQFGTPGTIGDMLHGDDQTRVLGLVTDGATARTVAQDMPGAYDLLPSSEYFDVISTPVVSFDGSALLIPYRDQYGDSIDSYGAFRDFLTDSAGLRTLVDPADLRTPSVLSPELLAHAANTHASVDTWVPPASLSLVSITGLGQETPSGYSYSGTPVELHCYGNLLSSDCSPQSWFAHTATLTIQGDDTVVSISAAGNPDQRYYFDAQAYEKTTNQNIVHQSLLNAEPIQSQLIDLIMNTEKVEPYLSTATPAYNIIPDTPELVVSAHSPMDLLATDGAGNESGIVPLSGTDLYLLKQDIPGSSVQVYDDEKYIYLPDASSTYTFTLQGTGTGSTTIDVGRANPDGSIAETQSFADIPTTPQTTGSFQVSQSMASSISVDTDGDGTIDLNVQAASSDSEEVGGSAAPAQQAPPATVTGHGTLTAPVAQAKAKSAGTSTPIADLIAYLKVKLLLLQLELELMKLLVSLHFKQM